jgi:hypothetical protein
MCFNIKVLDKKRVAFNLEDSLDSTRTSAPDYLSEHGLLSYPALGHLAYL